MGVRVGAAAVMVVVVEEGGVNFYTIQSESFEESWSV